MKIKIEQDTEAPIEKHVLAAAIIEMSLASKKLLASGLLRMDLVRLIHARCGYAVGGKPTLNDVGEVLRSLSQLVDDYKPVKK